MKGRVLIIAGSDPSGGAGIQADLKTVTALKGYGMAAITALTAQNTTGVYGVVPTPPTFIAQQVRLVLEDIGADAIKTGMVGNAAAIDSLVDVLEDMKVSAPIVVDPVMIAKGGASLLDPYAIATLKRRLLLHADILTPNIPEAEALSGMEIRNLDTMRHAADMLRTLGPKAVLLKGGHMAGDTVFDLLTTDEGEEVFESPRIDTPHTHGTGCTLSSAIATGLAQDMSLRNAVARAHAYVHAGIAKAPGLGKGHGPLNHVDAAENLV